MSLTLKNMNDEAVTNQLEENMRHLIKCVICKGVFADLKLLEPCQHLACIGCLQATRRDDDKFSCAECLQEILVPNGGVMQLKDSLMTRQIANIMKQDKTCLETTTATSQVTEIPHSVERSSTVGTPMAAENPSDQVDTTAQNVSPAGPAVGESAHVEDKKLIDESAGNTTRSDMDKVNAKAVKIMKNRKKCRHLRADLEKKSVEGFEWMRKIETNLSFVDEMIEKLPNQIKELKQRVIRIRDQHKDSHSVLVGDKIVQAAASKLESLEAVRRNEQQAMENYKREMEPKFYEVREALKDVEVIVNDLTPKYNKTVVVKAVIKLDKLNTFNFQRVLTLNDIVRGDSVRLRLNPHNLKSVKDLLREEDYSAVARVLGFEEGKLRVLMPNDNIQRLILPKDVCISLTPSTVHRAEDTVRIKVDPVRDDFEYEQDYRNAVELFTNKMEGILFDNLFERPSLMNIRARVIFPGGRVWEGQHHQLELVQFGLKRGTEMKLHGSKKPSRGFCGVSYSSIGILKTPIVDQGPDEDLIIDFPECHSWSGKDSDVQLFRHAFVEEIVQPGPSVDVNRPEWKGVKHKDTGVVIKLFYDDDNRKAMRVRFGSKIIERPVEELEMANMESVMKSFGSVLNPFGALLSQEMMRGRTQQSPEDVLQQLFRAAQNQ